jgi:hypothetical protein
MLLLLLVRIDDMCCAVLYEDGDKLDGVPANHIRRYRYVLNYHSHQTSIQHQHMAFSTKKIVTCPAWHTA